ncbi:mfs quinate transporter [Trichoderma arundinaceum]|uniref:Mfs quinate transporter n=1 Tax=Trichoderma arundinaceum TaxID=490622 RepID=A0A395NYC4_TRIAR|nr:mfs quinate transporter [Trichoderma arundinaceum]
MGVGAKKPVNIFRLKDLGEPEGALNWRLWFAVFSFGLLGAARGIDEGLISGAFNSDHFKESIHYASYNKVDQANIKANVSAMVQIGSVAGALFPIYVAEITPASIRGLCTCFFTGAVYLGVLLAYFANYGCQLHMSDDSADQWLVPTSLHIIMSGLIFVLSFFQNESPRYLIKEGKVEQAVNNLARLRQQSPDSDYIVREIALIQAALDHELEASRGVGFLGKVKELLLDKSNLYRVYLSSMVQLLSQWSGAGSITLYAPDLFKILGITGTNESLLVTAVFGLVKFVSAMVCALFLVDVIGRKRALLSGITLQAISMIYVAGFLTAVPQLGTEEDFILPEAMKGPSRGAVAMIYISGCGWALGWNSMQYLLTAELYPLRVRALATSWAMCLHFANQYGNSRAVPVMLLNISQGGISPKGTFWCFAAVTIVGGAWVWFFVPETGGRSLESMDRLFDLPWYKIGLHGNKDAEEKDMAVDEKQRMAEEEYANVQQVELKA